MVIKLIHKILSTGWMVGVTMGRSRSGLPNPRLTRPSQVTNFQTRRQPVRELGQIGQFFAGSGRVSIGVGSGRNLPDLAENWADLAEIWRIWPKISFVWRDLYKIMLDLVRSDWEIAYTVGIGGLFGGRIGRVGWNWVKLQGPTNPLESGWIPQKPLPTCHGSWIGRFRIRSVGNSGGSGTQLNLDRPNEWDGSIIWASKFCG